MTYHPAAHLAPRELSGFPAHPASPDLIDRLKATLGRKLSEQYRSRLPAALLRRAVDEAEELARGTGYPHLFFPLLAEEKAGLLSRFFMSAPKRQPSPAFCCAA